MRMYVAIEGIKGTGKSSIIEGIGQSMLRIGTEFSLYPITKAMPSSHPLELLHRHHPFLKEEDAFLEQLYAQRAIWQQGQLKNKTNILGDRSIITSYVTRWAKWGDPYYTIKRAHAHQRGIEPPRVIIWLRCPAGVAYRNIQKRAPKRLGRVDEGAERLEAAAAVYEELFVEKLYHRKIERADIIEVPACGSLGEVRAEIIQILKHYYQL